MWVCLIDVDQSGAGWFKARFWGYAGRQKEEKQEMARDNNPKNRDEL